MSNSVGFDPNLGDTDVFRKSGPARMQVELLNRKRWKTRIELANAIFEYLEVFHNRQRRHSSLRMHTPIEYERIHDTQTLARLSQVS